VLSALGGAGEQIRLEGARGDRNGAPVTVSDG
jgi:hypothetical protein